MTADRDLLADLVEAVELLAVVGHAHLRDLAARARAHLDACPPAEPAAPINADPLYRAGWDAGVEYGQHLAGIAARARERAAYAAGRARGAGAQP